MSKVTLHDISLRDYKMEDFKRLERLRQIHFQLIPEICVERAGYITKYLKDLSDLKDPPILRQAKALKYELDNKTPIIWHHRGIDAKLNELNFYEDNLLAGSTTSKAKGVQLYPEFLSMSIWPELLTIQKRKSNPFYITQKDIEALTPDDVRDLHDKYYVASNIVLGIVGDLDVKIIKPILEKYFGRLPSGKRPD